MPEVRHGVMATLKNNGTWRVECQDCEFNLPALNQADAKRLVALHLRLVTEVALNIQEDKNESESNQ